MIAAVHFSSSLPLARRRSKRFKISGQPTEAQEMAIQDAVLVQRFKAGDESAFMEIMTRYQSRMFSIAMAKLNNRADAEEIAQDTFIRAHRALTDFRGEASLATWLYRITQNLSCNRYWYHHRRRRHVTLSLDLTFGETNPSTLAELVAADTIGPDRAVEANEFSELVVMCMERLDAQPREILMLRNSMNLSYHEIAHKLGIRVGTVKSRVARARERLKVLMYEACPESATLAGPENWFDPARRPSGLVHCA